MAFAQQLSEARAKRKISQAAAAALLGLSRRSYIELEKGRKEPRSYEMSGMLAVLAQKPVAGKETAKEGQPVAGHYTLHNGKKTVRLPFDATLKELESACDQLYRKKIIERKAQ